MLYRIVRGLRGTVPEFSRKFPGACERVVLALCRSRVFVVSYTVCKDLCLGAPTVYWGGGSLPACLLACLLASGFSLAGRLMFRLDASIMNTWTRSSFFSLLSLRRSSQPIRGPHLKLGPLPNVLNVSCFLPSRLPSYLAPIFIRMVTGRAAREDMRVVLLAGIAAADRGEHSTRGGPIYSLRTARRFDHSQVCDHIRKCNLVGFLWWVIDLDVYSLSRFRRW